jgi:hypothetical protein
MSDHKPIGITKADDKISKAGREYYYHCAKLQLRFKELINVIENDITPNFKSQSFISWLMQSGPKPIDTKVLRKLKTELKHFEICSRIFEQVCIETILET